MLTDLEDLMMAEERRASGKEPKSDLARYAFGFTDKKPGGMYWLIIGVMTATVAAHFWSIF